MKVLEYKSDTIRTILFGLTILLNTASKAKTEAISYFPKPLNYFQKTKFMRWSVR